MKLGSKACAAVFAATLLPGFAGAQTTYEMRNGEVIAVHGNYLIARGADGVQEVEVPTDFRFERNGQRLGIRDLTPGMKLTADVPSAQAPVFLTATALDEAEIAYVNTDEVVVKVGEERYQRLSSRKMHSGTLVIYKDGRAIAPITLKEGDRLTAIVITKAPPIGMSPADLAEFLETAPRMAVPARSLSSLRTTEKVIPNLAQPGTEKPADGARPEKPASAPAAADTPPEEPAPAPVAAGAPKALPKTAGHAGVIALAGVLMLGLGLAATVRRLSRG